MSYKDAMSAASLTWKSVQSGGTSSYQRNRNRHRGGSHKTTALQKDSRLYANRSDYEKANSAFMSMEWV